MPARSLRAWGCYDKLLYDGGVNCRVRVSQFSAKTDANALALRLTAEHDVRYHEQRDGKSHEALNHGIRPGRE